MAFVPSFLRHLMPPLTVALLSLSTLCAGEQPVDLGGTHPDRAKLLEAILAPPAIQPGLIEQLVRLEDPAIGPVLEAYRRGELFVLGETEGPENLILLDFTTEAAGLRPATFVATGAPVTSTEGETRLVDPATLRFLRTNSRIRRSIGRTVQVVALNAPLPETRKDAAERLGTSGNTEFLPYLTQRREVEAIPGVQRMLETSIALLELDNPDPATRSHSLETLARSRSLVARARLESFLQDHEAGGAGSTITPEMAALARAGIDAIERHWKRVNFVADFFRGLSLGSILLIMAMGLAITFGLMGVINMAHGELMVIGAYATFVTQNLFAGWFGPTGAGFSAYFLCALPVAFVASATAGLILERSIIQFLYKRPLESLLATWGVSLILQQIFRVVFGPSNVQINAPAYLTGNFVAYDILFAYNRVFVIGFSAFLVALVWLILTRTSIGLNVRAVMQNATMAACMGIRTRRVNMLTFAFGSGLAGLAGACLTQLTNVGPSLGQSHIVDSFMVVVAGGVGNIFGTVIAALGIGTVDQVLQPFLGAVMGKITVLFAIILFLQWRPGGLFPTRSRSLD